MKSLKIDYLLSSIKAQFDKLKSNRAKNEQYDLGDVLQSGLAIFSLKDNSLLEYIERYPQRSMNLKRIYGIKKCPSDSQLRKIIDQVSPQPIERIKRSVIHQVKTTGLLEEYEYFKGWKLLLVDGVHHFSSQQVKCDQCQERHHENGSTTYSHSMLASVIAHPEKKEVLPLCEEPIAQQDGATKNDCELNASRRLLHKVSLQHLKEKFIFVEDALFANGPHIKAIQEKGHRFIIRVKPGSGAGSILQQYDKLKVSKDSDVSQNPSEDTTYKQHKLYKRHKIKKPMPPAEAAVQLHEVILMDDDKIKVWHFVNNLYLNESHPDIKINFLHYEERSIKNGKLLKSFDWITDIHLTKYNVKKVGKSGRCRWMIENETFNTLKNQGYHFEHNFGHGHQNLCTNFALLMMLAFLVDQIQQLSNKLFNEAVQAARAKKYLWEDIRSYFRTLPFINSMEMIYKAIIFGIKVDFSLIEQDP